MFTVAILYATHESKFSLFSARITRVGEKALSFSLCNSLLNYFFRNFV